MKRDVFIIVYLLVMVTTIIALDFLFLQRHFTWRLFTNIGVALLFILFYLFVFRKFIN